MGRHLVKLVWRRKRSVALLVTEIFFSFLVVFAVAGIGLTALDAWRRPLGFDAADVWRVEIRTTEVSDDAWDEEQTGRFGQLLEGARRTPGVVAAAGALFAPYEFGSRTSNTEVDGREVTVEINEVTDELPAVLRFAVVEGRWFGREDDGNDWQPVVIDREAAELFFPGESPIGKVYREHEFAPSGVTHSDTARGAMGQGEVAEQRVVGVLADFRRAGELSAPAPYVFERIRVGATSSRPPRNLLLRVAPGATGELEERLVATFDTIAPEYSFTLHRVADQRASSFRFRLAPLVAGGVVAAFLLLMVALGLTGVVWQNVTQRTREIGLRRAIGASGRDVHLQLLFELLLTGSLGAILGAIVVAQLPLIDLAFVSTPVHFAALAVAAVVVLAIVALASFYPTLAASRVQPAAALRWE